MQIFRKGDRATQLVPAEPMTLIAVPSTTWHYLELFVITGALLLLLMLIFLCLLRLMI